MPDWRQARNSSVSGQQLGSPSRA